MRSRRRPILLLVALLLCVTTAACGSGGADERPPTQPAVVVTSTPLATERAATTPVPALPTPSPAASTEATVEPTESTASTTPLVLPTPRQVEQAAPPVRLRIPALGIDTTVQWVGVDAEGRLGVPSNYTDVAWYQDGPAPGTPGNAVIDGHLDSTTGPAVFYRLEDLKPGDEIFTVTGSGTEYRFVVTTSEVYDANNAPLDRIFGTAVKPYLNLITCDGAFDRSIRQYDKRLVVYTELAPGT